MYGTYHLGRLAGRIEHTLALLIAIVLILSVASTLWAQEGDLAAPPVVSFEDALADLMDNPYYPALYQDEIRLLVEQHRADLALQPSATSSNGATVFDAAMADLMDNPYYPELYQDEIRLLVEQHNSSELTLPR